MITYTYDVPNDQESIAGGIEHVTAHLSAIAAEDDDPETNADDVVIDFGPHPDDSNMTRIVGRLDAEPNAPYLQPGYDPYANVDPSLFTAEIEAAEADVEVLRGQA